MLNSEVKKSIDESVLCWLATSNKTNEPNCSPKEVFTYYGDSEIVIADIASPTSVNNIRENPNVCVSFVHTFKQKGFKVKGKAVYLTSSDSKYNELYPLISPIVGTIFPVKGLISISVENIKAIIAPAYYMVAGTTEESQVQSAKRTYGV